MDGIHLAQDNEQCEYDTEPLGFIKGGTFLDQLSNCFLHKKHSVLWRFVPFVIIAATSYYRINCKCVIPIRGMKR